jgi:hypothetical protein
VLVTILVTPGFSYSAHERISRLASIEINDRKATKMLAFFFCAGCSCRDASTVLKERTEESVPTWKQDLWWLPSIWRRRASTSPVFLVLSLRMIYNVRSSLRRVYRGGSSRHCDPCHRAVYPCGETKTCEAPLGDSHSLLECCEKVVCVERGERHRWTNLENVMKWTIRADQDPAIAHDVDNAMGFIRCGCVVLD